MLGRNTSTIADTTSLVWHRLPKATHSHQVGNWFTIRAGRASLVDSELVSTPFHRYIEIGTFNAVNQEVMPRIVRTLGHVAAKYPCSELRGNIGSLYMLGNLAAMFGHQRTQVVLPATAERPSVTVPFEQGMARLYDITKTDRPAPAVDTFGARLLITTDELCVSDFPVPICRTEPDYA